MAGASLGFWKTEDYGFLSYEKNEDAIVCQSEEMAIEKFPIFFLTFPHVKSEEWKIRRSHNQIWLVRSPHAV